MYETYYHNIQPYFLVENLHFQYIDTDAFVLGKNSNKIIKDLQNLIF